MSTDKKLVIVLSLFFSFSILNGQQTPLNPVSYWVFVPYIYNPAIVGSKDFISVDLNTTFLGKSNTQILSGNTRFSKIKPGYFSSPGIFEFKNVGVGGSVFRDKIGLTTNYGASAAGSDDPGKVRAGAKAAWRSGSAFDKSDRNNR